MGGPTVAPLLQSSLLLEFSHNKRRKRRPQHHATSKFHCRVDTGSSIVTKQPTPTRSISTSRLSIDAQHANQVSVPSTKLNTRGPASELVALAMKHSTEDSNASLKETSIKSGAVTRISPLSEMSATSDETKPTGEPQKATNPPLREGNRKSQGDSLTQLAARAWAKFGQKYPGKRTAIQIRSGSSQGIRKNIAMDTRNTRERERQERLEKMDSEREGRNFVEKATSTKGLILCRVLIGRS